MTSDDGNLDEVERWLLSVERQWSSESPVRRIKAFPKKLFVEGGIGFTTAGILTGSAYIFDHVVRSWTSLQLFPDSDQAPAVFLAAGVFITGLVFCNLIKEIEN